MDSKVSWLQKVSSGVAQAVQRGHRNPQDRYHCCPGAENQQLQRQRCHFTPDKAFCLHRSGTLNPSAEHLAPGLPPAAVQSSGMPREDRAQPHIPPITVPIFHLLMLPAKLLIRIHCFVFWGFFLFLSNWWRLPLCGKSLHGRWFCKIPLAVACETCKSIRALLGQFS